MALKFVSLVAAIVLIGLGCFLFEKGRRTVDEDPKIISIVVGRLVVDRAAQEYENEQVYGHEKHFKPRRGYGYPRYYQYPPYTASTQPYETPRQLLIPKTPCEFINNYTCQIEDHRLHFYEIHFAKWPQGVVDYLKSDEALGKIADDPRFSKIAGIDSWDKIDRLRARFDVSIDSSSADMTISYKEKDEARARATLLFIGDRIHDRLRSDLPDVSLHYKWSPREVKFIRTGTH